MEARRASGPAGKPRSRVHRARVLRARGRALRVHRFL